MYQPWPRFAVAPGIGPLLANFATVAVGLDAFFTPNPIAFLNARMQLGPESAGYYSTLPLEKTLTELADFSLVAAAKADQPDIELGFKPFDIDY